MAINFVEIAADPVECAFDQPCRFGNRVDGHAVYCHNDAWTDGPRKCRRSWYTGGETKDEDCPGFEKNPAFTGQFLPSPINGTRCVACNGIRLKTVSDDKKETCPRCCGEGSDPKAMKLSTFEQGALESAYPFGVGEWFVLTADTDDKSASVHKLLARNLLELRSLSFANLVSIYLVRLTGKGNAVMRANWAAAKA